MSFGSVDDDLLHRLHSASGRLDAHDVALLPRVPLFLPARIEQDRSVRLAGAARVFKIEDLNVNDRSEPGC